MIIPDPVPFIAAWFVGAAIAIIAGARPEKRKKYMNKVLAFYLGFIGGYLLIFLLCELYDHLDRRKEFKQWKISKIK